MDFVIHRKSDIKLFTQRFKTRAIFSEAQLKEVIQEIQKVNKDYAACCMLSETMTKYEWMKPYNQKLFIQIEQNKQTLNKDELQRLLSDMLKRNRIELIAFKRNKTLRNEWIKQLRQKYDCNLKCLADVLELTESSISKIINS